MSWGGSQPNAAPEHYPLDSITPPVHAGVTRGRCGTDRLWLPCPSRGPAMNGVEASCFAAITRPFEVCCTWIFRSPYPSLDEVFRSRLPKLTRAVESSYADLPHYNCPSKRRFGSSPARTLFKSWGANHCFPRLRGRCSAATTLPVWLESRSPRDEPVFPLGGQPSPLCSRFRRDPLHRSM